MRKLLFILVVLSLAPTVSFSQQDSVIATIPVTAPGSIAFCPVNNHIYSSTDREAVTDGRIYVINALNYQVVDSIMIGAPLGRLLYNPINNKLYCTIFSGGIAIIDCTTDSIIATLSTQRALEIILNSVNNKVYVTNDVQGAVTIVDGYGDSIITTISLGSDYSRGLVYNPKNNTIFCALQNSCLDFVINGTTNSVIDTVSIGLQVFHQAYNSQENKIYCAAFTTQTITVIDGATNQVIKTLNVSYGPYSLTYNPIDNKVYCGHLYTGLIRIIDGKGDSTITTVSVGGEPMSLLHNPITDRIYCGKYQAGNYISVLDGVSNSLTQNITTGNPYHTLCLNNIYNKIYCSNKGGNTVSVISSGNARPILAHIPDTVAVVSGSVKMDTLFLNIRATDPDGTIPHLYTQNLPTNSFFIDSTNGSGAFIFFPDSIQTDSVYNVLFIASDDALTDNLTVSIRVILYVRGDANGDGKVSVSDVVYLINYLFKVGPAPYPWQAGDDNRDKHVTITDVVYLINYLFKGGPSPCNM